MKHTDERPRTLAKMFELYTLDELAKIGSNLKKLLKGTDTNPDTFPSRKADRIKWITPFLKNQDCLRHLYENMTSLEQSFIQEGTHSEGGFVDVNRFKAKYGNLPQFTLSSYDYFYNERKTKAFPPLVLFFTSRAVMPADIQPVFKKIVPKPKGVEATSVSQLPETVEVSFFQGQEHVPLVQHSTEQAAMNDLMAVLQLADMGKISVSAKTGKPAKPSVKAIRNVLSGGDFYPEDIEAPYKYDVQIGDAGIRPFAWTMLIQAGTLAKVSGTRLELTQTGRSAMQKPAHEVIARLWDRWIKNKLIHEMSRIEVIKGQKSKRRPLFAAEQGRQSIADALAEMDEGVWTETDDFFRFLIAKGHGFDIIRDDWKLYLGDPNYGSFGYNHITWEHLNGRFARAFLMEYAATLGLIDIAVTQPWGAVSDLRRLWGADEYTCLSRYDGLYALRINSLGAWILGQKQEYEPTFHDEPCLRILPNLEIVSVAAKGSSSDEIFLDRFCEKTSERVWRITLPKLLKSVEEGVDLKSIITFIRDRSQGPLPQPVQVFFDDAGDRVSKVQDMGEARLVKCADNVLVKLIVNDSTLKNLCSEAGDNHLVILREHENRFRSALRKLGYVLC